MARGYSNLRFAANVDSTNVNPVLLQKLNVILKSLGKTGYVFSGYRSPQHSVEVGGFANDPHTRGIAVDISVNGTPIGYTPGFMNAARKAGLISGNQPNFYKGQSDPAHVQLGGGSVTPKTTAKAAPKALPKITAYQWTDDVLNGLGAPITDFNRTLLLGWAYGENTNAAYNPLATTQPMPGATPFNNLGGGGHVWNYPDYKTGLTATISTLTNGYYNGIVSDLRKGNVLPTDIATNRASEFSTWGTGADLVKAGVKRSATEATKGGGFIKAITGIPATDVKTFVTDPAAAVTTAIEKPLKDLGMYLVYGVAFLGGALVLLTGFVLIGADIGLAVFARTQNAAPVKLGRKAVTKLGGTPSESDQNLSAFRKGESEGRLQAARREGQKSGREQIAGSGTRAVGKQRTRSFTPQNPPRRRRVKRVEE